MGPKYRDAAKSELDAQRELLDSLMGMNRNNDKKYQNLDYRDDRVCKFFLTGMCPHGKLMRETFFLFHFDFPLYLIFRYVCEYKDGRRSM